MAHPLIGAAFRPRSARATLFISAIAVVLSALACNIIRFGGGEVGPTPAPTTEVLAGEPLRAGRVLAAEHDVMIGAVEAAFEGELAMHVDVAAEAQLPPLPNHVDRVGQPLRITPDQSILLDPDRPLIVGLPVPDTSNYDHLALAILLEPREIDHFPSQHQVEPGRTTPLWVVLPGRYDPANQLLLSTLADLPADGRVLSLVVGTTYDSGPPAESRSHPGRLAQTLANPSFNARCIPAGDDSYTACTDAMQMRLENFAMQAYTRYVTDAGFREPRLRRGFQLISLAPPDIQFNDVYQLEIQQPVEIDANEEEEDKGNPSACQYTMNADESERLAGPLGGVYLFSARTFAVCLASSSNPDFGPDDKTSFSQSLVQHEFFHALQYAYPEVASNRGDRERSYFEGMATTAQDSNVTQLVRRSSRGVRDIDVGLFRGSNRTFMDRHAYNAQDFFLYFGRRYGLSLPDLLIPYLDEGPTREDVDAVFRSHPSFPSGYSLSHAYWDWVRNQAFEKIIDVGGSSLGQDCELQGRALNEDPVKIDYRQAAPPEPRSLTLPPLTSAVVEVEFKALEVSYQTHISVQPSNTFVFSAFYHASDAGTPRCQYTQAATELDVSVDPIVNQTIYILLSNSHLRDVSQATITFQPQEGFSILSPSEGAVFQEGDSIPFQALASGIGDPDISFSIDWSYIRHDGVPFTFRNSQNGKTLHYSSFCDGTYTVTAEALVPNDPKTYSDNVTITVEDLGATNPPEQCEPVISIDRPTDGGGYTTGESLLLQASIDDDHPETNSPLYPVIWRLGGPSGSIIARGLQGSTKLGEGQHRIHVEYGAASDQVTIQAGQNELPAVSIDEPDSGEAFQAMGNVPVTFRGHADDPEDGALSGDALQWSYKETSSADDFQFAGTGEQVTITFSGSCNWVEYTVRLRAIDSDGGEAFDEITISARGPIC